MSSSYLPLSFPLHLSRRHHFVDLTFTPFSVTKHLPPPSLFEPLLCFSISPSSNSNYEREESRWLREEQRWLREESRWKAEREFLNREISALMLRIQELENRDLLQGATASESMANIAALLQVLKTKEVDLGNSNWIADRGSSAVPIVLEFKASESGKMEEEVVKEVVTLSQKDESEGREDVKKTKNRETLRKGSEGVDVRFLQEALQRLGFYSGEEDMEYSSFSSGTERAVKTWQASVGIREDGVMTCELQERLLSGVITEMNPKGKNPNSFTKNPENGAAMVKKEAEASQDHHHHHPRVYLLGENRWEEPSRLIGRNKKDSKCLQCRGEGRLLCTGCDGTGEPNLEPQFMEWFEEEEGAKCAYCEGCGFVVCDLCEGKTIV